nr:ATP synthase F0 subunit 6 [Acinopterus sp.]
MMTNLFSTFDPSTGIMSLNWMSMLIMFLLPENYWNLKGKMQSMISKMNTMLSKEMKMLSNHKGTTIIMISLFNMILINNMMGLFPYVYTSSAQISVSLTLALSLWTAMMLFGWIKKTNDMLCHLVPVGTPGPLMPFMVMIESVSNMIRPGSLAVRLSANMIAGHILMSLLGNSLTEKSTLIFIFMWLFMGLMIFELAVAFIQAYVFMTLSNLYSSEI